MKPIRKRFDRALFQQNDELARNAVIYHLFMEGLLAEPHTDRYGIDLTVRKPESRDTIYGVECEIKRVWTGPVLKYDTVQLPGRKAKYLNNPWPIEYWILNNELTHAIIIPGHLVEASTPVEVPNKYVYRGELFYQIPVAQCSVVMLSRPEPDSGDEVDLQEEHILSAMEDEGLIPPMSPADGGGE